LAGDLSDEILERALSGRFGRYRRVYDSIDSTNLEALRWAAEEGAPEGALVVADVQTTGRGRWGRSWLAEPGRALMFSAVVRPLEAAAARLLSTAAGLAVAEGIDKTCGIETKLRWPNDVLAGDRKLGGILVESRSAGHALDAFVVGVGINLYLRGGDLPDEVAERATSISAQVADVTGGIVPARAELLGAILLELETVLQSMTAMEGRVEVVRRVERRSAVIGGRVVVRYADGRTSEGRATGLSAEGGLVLDDRITVTAGEIELLRPAP